MEEVPIRLQSVANDIASNPKLGMVGYPVTPREILSWFGQHRRTWRQVQRIRDAFEELKLYTWPDFEGAGIDEIVDIMTLDGFEKLTAEMAKFDALYSAIPPTPPTTIPTTTTTFDPNLANSTQSPSEASASSISGAPESSSLADPVHRVSRFLREGKVISVTRDQEIIIAVTQMLLHDFSQLPVMQGARTVQGMISWESIGKRQALGSKAERVSDCMEQHYEVRSSASIFDAIRVIQEHDCVLVRGDKQDIVGVLTAADISSSFEQISKPYLLLGYIENRIRSLVKQRFSIEQLQTAKDPSDEGRIIEDVSDMTFGEYVRLLGTEENWKTLAIEIDRKLFIQQLDAVRVIRNDVMHFNPEGIEDEHMTALSRFNSFLQSIVDLIAAKSLPA